MHTNTALTEKPAEAAASVRSEAHGRAVEVAKLKSNG